MPAAEGIRYLADWEVRMGYSRRLKGRFEPGP